MERGAEPSGQDGQDGFPEYDRPAGPGLPLLPGFREMALRRMSAERRRLVEDLTAQRRSAGLYMIGCFTAYLLGPILMRFDS